MVGDGESLLKFLDTIPEAKMNTNRNIAEVLFILSRHFDRKRDLTTAKKLLDYALPIYQVTYG